MDRASNMQYVINVIRAGKEVFSRKSYLAVSLIGAFVLYSLNAVVQNFRLLKGNFSLPLLWSLIMGLKATFTPFSYILLILISVLGGVVLTFSIYLLRRQISMGASAGIGAVAAIVAPACPSCALGVLGSVGLGSLAGFFPLGGVELALLALLLLVVSAAYLSSKIVSPVVCRQGREIGEVKKNKREAARDHP